MQVAEGGGGGVEATVQHSAAVHSEPEHVTEPGLSFKLFASPSQLKVSGVPSALVSAQVRAGGGGGGGGGGGDGSTAVQTPLVHTAFLVLISLSLHGVSSGCPLQSVKQSPKSCCNSSQLKLLL